MPKGTIGRQLSRVQLKWLLTLDLSMQVKNPKRCAPVSRHPPRTPASFSRGVGPPRVDRFLVPLRDAPRASPNPRRARPVSLTLLTIP